MLARRKGESKRFRACGCGPAEARALIRTYFVLNRALTAQGSAPVSAQPKDSSLAGEGACGPQISLVARARTAETPVPQNGFGCYFWVFSVPPRLRGGCLFFGCDAESCPDSTGRSACATKWLWLFLLGFLRASAPPRLRGGCLFLVVPFGFSPCLRASVVNVYFLVAALQRCATRSTIHPKLLLLHPTLGNSLIYEAHSYVYSS